MLTLLSIGIERLSIAMVGDSPAISSLRVTAAVENP